MLILALLGFTLFISCTKKASNLQEIAKNKILKTNHFYDQFLCMRKKIKISYIYFSIHQEKNKILQAGAQTIIETTIIAYFIYGHEPFK